MNREITAAERRKIGRDVQQDTMEHELRDVAQAACRQIAPLWPLQDFVAVNPMLGQIGLDFEEAALRLARNAGAKLLLDRKEYAAGMARGDFSERHLTEAIKHVGGPDSKSATAIADALRQGEGAPPEKTKTVADLACEMSGDDWPSFIVDQISAWAAGFFDQGQSAWKNPWRSERPFAAWRTQASIDRTPEIMGLQGFRAQIAALNPDPLIALAQIADQLWLQPSDCADYFHRLLSTIAGWVGYRRYEGWRNELQGAGPDGVIDLLAIRAAYDLALLKCLRAPALADAWRSARQSKAEPPQELTRIALIAQTAAEFAYQEGLLGKIASNRNEPGAARPMAQAVFCIDVRSERIRRALEITNPSIETFGFAGFFGFPLELVRTDERGSMAQCPVLLQPSFSVCEHAHSGEETGGDRLLANLKAFAGAWKRFKTGAISSFAFVESLGGAFAGALVRDSARRPAPETARLGALGDCRNGEAEMSIEGKVNMARGALAGISFNGRYARIIALVGHGSTTTNNPYAAGLDCGACGGHSGEANARVAAATLNDPEVRRRLTETGSAIPDDTVFVAALHDTTTDEIRILNECDICSSHAQDLACLKRDFIGAARASRRERAPSLGLDQASEVDSLIDARSRDWSEVRPEWGLAGCAAFIAAPRARTIGVDLEGRTFLHSYEWRADADNSILELIMTAPLVVASWISLQYYASSVDNQVFGSGDKTLHNVVGGFGVMEGAGGDLRVGLPLQSVHDGDNLVHQPLRLTALIEAPKERIDAVIGKHENVRALFENGWMHLIAYDDETGAFFRYARKGWIPLDFAGKGKDQTA